MVYNTLVIAKEQIGGKPESNETKAIDAFEERLKLSRETSMLHWWPRVVDIDIPMPRTEIIPLSIETVREWWEKEGVLPEEVVARLEAAINRLGFPVFLRTDFMSAKFAHEFRSVIRDKTDIKGAAMDLSDAHSEGFGTSTPQALVVREHLDLVSSFKSRSGRPITAERRYFVRDGRLECHHPYWIEDAIARDHYMDHGLPQNWKELLARMNEESEEVGILTEHAGKLAAALEGWWSLDFAKATDGKWYFIDAAKGAVSWHLAECQHEPEEQIRDRKEAERKRSEIPALEAIRALMEPKDS